MVVIFQWWLCAVLLFSSAIQAQDANLPASPDPVALEANWWAYFEPGETVDKTGQDARIEKSRALFEQMLKGLDAEQRSSLAPQIKNIHEGLRQLSSLAEAAPGDAPSLPPAAETYTVSQALERFVLWRKLKRELDLEQEDLAWQSAQLSLERKRQAQRRNDYLTLAMTDPQRLSRGIALMSSRVSLELAAIQSKRRHSKLKNDKLRLQRLEDELGIIHQRLVASSIDEKNWLNEQSKARSKADFLRQQAGPAVNDQSPDTPLGSANIKRLLLLSSGTEVRLSIQEFTAMRYRMMHALEQLISVNAKTQNLQGEESLAELLKQFKDFKQSISAQQQSWRSLTEQARKFASAKMSEQEQTDLSLSQAYKDLIKKADDNDRLLRELQLEQGIGSFLADLVQAKLNEDVGWFKRWLILSGGAFDKSWEQASDWFHATLFEINEAPVTTAGLLRVLLIISIALLLSKIFRRGLGRLGQRKDGVNASSLYTLGRVIHYIVLIVGIMIGLSSIGIDLTKFALFASALGVGIGFGLQTLISNFVAGLIILFERSLKAGDFVELASGVVGEVREINMRSTLVTTNDNIDILVPNSEFMNGQVTNWTLRDTQRRIHVSFGVAYGTDKELVKKAVLEAADDVKWTLNDTKQRAPQVWFVQFGDSSLNFELVVWLKPDAVNRPGAVQAAYLWEIDTKLREYGIEVPFPQRDLHLRSVFGQKDESGLELLK